MNRDSLNTSACIADPLNLFLGPELSGVVFKHDRYAVPDGISETIGLAYQLLTGFIVYQRTFAQRAYQNVQQLGIHYFPILRNTSSPKAGSIVTSTRIAQKFLFPKRSHFTASFSVMMTVA